MEMYQGKKTLNWEHSDQNIKANPGVDGKRMDLFHTSQKLPSFLKGIGLVSTTFLLSSSASFSLCSFLSRLAGVLLLLLHTPSSSVDSFKTSGLSFFM